MGTYHFEEGHRRKIKKLDVYGEISNKNDCLVTRLIMIAVPKGEAAARKTQVILLRKTPAQQNQKVGSIISMLRRESGSVGFSLYLIIRLVPSASPAK